MLRQSIAQNLKDQNWLGIWIDLVIVVVGVFIGLEIANWYQDQSDRDGVQRLALRLESDFAHRTLELDRLLEAHYEATIAIDSILTALEKGDDLSQDEAAEKLQSALYVESLPSLPISFVEMVSTGRLDLLEDQGLRDALREIQNFAAAYERVSFQAYYGDYQSKISPYYRVSRQPSRRVSEEPITWLDLRKLWADQHARTALYNLYDLHRLSQLWIQVDLERTQWVMDEITTSKSK